MVGQRGDDPTGVRRCDRDRNIELRRGIGQGRTIPNRFGAEAESSEAQGSYFIGRVEEGASTSPQDCL